MLRKKITEFVLLNLGLTLTISTGCIHKSEKTFEQAIRSPAEFEMSNEFEDLNPENQMVFEAPVEGEEKKINCLKLQTREETFNGQSYTRYNVSDASQLSCPQVKALKQLKIQTLGARHWEVKKSMWTPQDELGYQKFIRTLGQSKCNTADKCLSGPSNILRTEEDMLSVFYTDCADLPYYLRSYYAYKNNLPMTFVMEMVQNPFSADQLARHEKEREKIRAENSDLVIQNEKIKKFDDQLKDKRYSQAGNSPVSRLNIPSSSGAIRDFDIVAPQIVNIISSGFMRMTSPMPGGLVQPDFYSPKVTPEAITPGTVLYNPSGHVAVVYEINAKGEALFMDAHPDNSLTRGKLNADFKRLSSIYGGNFKKFRPIYIDNAKATNGVIRSGTIRVVSDAQIPEYSLEQYNGDGIDAAGNGVFKLNPTDTKPAFDFHEWVKYRLSRGTYRLHPTEEMTGIVDSLCTIAQNRVTAVELGRTSGIALAPHPLNLPKNIYGAAGEWESYSSPGSDLRLRNKILEIADVAKIWVNRYRIKDPLVVYKGLDIKKDLISAYAAAAGSCKVNYINSSGQQVSLTLNEIISRAALLSFDPYMCPEVRWGATSSQELATCTDTPDKKEWNKYQQFLRNLTGEKQVNAVHGFSLDQLRKMHTANPSINIDKSPNFNIVKKLQGL